VKLWPVVSRAVEEGVAHGLRRSNKYNDEAPVDTDRAAEHLQREIMNALCEVLNFGDEEGE
jgi:hypothetical protein